MSRSASPAALPFQFTPLREGRPGVSFSCLLWLFISIHAPPRGATRNHRSNEHAGNFNSRPSARGDVSGLRGWSLTEEFQFTPLREGRRTASGIICATWTFQFTPLREGRRKRSCWPCTASNFNSRPSARGDAAKAAEDAQARRNFNSRPSARGDHEQRTHCAGLAISIHAPPRGATRQTCITGSASAYFNSRPSARGDRLVRADFSGGKFQFTPLREGRRLRLLALHHGL